MTIARNWLWKCGLRWLPGSASADTSVLRIETGSLGFVKTVLLKCESGPGVVIVAQDAISQNRKLSIRLF